MSIGSFIEDDIIEPLVEDVADPILNALRAAAASEVATIAAAANKALSTYKPGAPASTGPLNAIASGVQTGVDALISTALGRIPVLGEIVDPEAVALANEGLEDLESKGISLVQGLLAAAATKLTSIVAGAPPAVAAVS